ncbi:MAG: hypothetical protein IPN72_19900 [Saprospiraceae bacterium]|nr:hypothetical protein [Saprospiraceae bacterium]
MTTINVKAFEINNAALEKGVDSQNENKRFAFPHHFAAVNNMDKIKINGQVAKLY